MAEAWPQLEAYPTIEGPFLRLPGGLEVKASACNAGDLGSIPGSGRSLGEENGNPLQYSYLENPMDRGAWLGTALGVGKIVKLVHVPIKYSCVKNHART